MVVRHGATKRSARDGKMGWGDKLPADCGTVENKSRGAAFFHTPTAASLEDRAAKRTGERMTWSRWIGSEAQEKSRKAKGG